VLVATNAEKLAAVEAKIKTINPEVQVLSVAADISDASSVAELFAKIKAKFGHADILINNAAILAGGGTMHEEDPAQWWKNFVWPLATFRHKNTS
jgi:NAD(P)-dependent dehydrogenase (short-subunit alcohol dehydrogenase family)